MMNIKYFNERISKIFLKQLFSVHQNIRSILEKSEIGEQVLSELAVGKLCRKSRIKMVQVLVAYIINHFGERYVKIFITKTHLTYMTSMILSF